MDNRSFVQDRVKINGNKRLNRSSHIVVNEESTVENFGNMCQRFREPERVKRSALANQ